MKKGIRYFLPGALFCWINLSVASVNLYFFKGIIYFGGLLLLFFFLRDFDLSRLLKPIVLGISAIIFLYGLFQKYLIFPKILDQFVRQQDLFSRALIERVKSGRIFSIFSLPTLYAIICAVAIICIIHYLREYAQRENRNPLIVFLYILLLMTGLFNLVLTQSFGGILYLSIGILIYLIIERIIDLKYISLILMTIALILFVIISLRYREAKRFEPVKLRLTNWKQAIRMIEDQPFFGVGLGNYGANVSYYVKRKEARSLYTHNFPLQIVSEIGVPFSLFLLGILLVNRRRLLQTRGGDRSLYISILAMMVVYNLIDIGLYFFSAGIICVIALSQLYRSSRSYVTVKLGFLMIAVVIYGSLAISDSDVAEANIDLNQGRVADARKSFDRSLGFNPFNFSAYLGRAISDPAGLQTDSARNDIQRSLKLFPQYASGLFYHSLIDFRNGYLLSALYHAGAAFHKHRLSKQYRNWYEFVKKKLPSRNLIQRN